VRTFSADVTAPNVVPGSFRAFRREWDTQMREAFPLPGLDVGESGDFRIRVRAVKADDVVIAEVHSESFTGVTAGAGDADARALIHLMRRGAWHFTGTGGRAARVTVPSGHFIARHNGDPSLFSVDPGAAASVLIMPASVLTASNGDRPLVGSMQAAEVRLLTAYAGMVGEAVRDLTAGGVRAARDALLELVRGVVRQQFDDVEPRLAPALVAAARTVVDEHLADPDLTPSAVARELAVSVRTLHRAFAESEEPVMAYIRHSRLKQARRELAAPFGRTTVSEVAARWQFSDSSHFIRTFKARYGQTPAQFARTQRATGGTSSP
jgi:AraC family transcriptional regulator, positive regulator of tynA and feaB